MTEKIAAILLIALSLLACAPSETDVPRERPLGSVSGRAVAAPIGNAQVTVYGFGGGARGARLGSAQTKADGSFEIPIQAPDQPVLLELRGGQYVEEAGGARIALAEGLVLRAVGHYQSGQPLTLLVTPLTHMVTALAEYHHANGMPVEQAIDTANTAVNAFFALDVQSTNPAAIAPLSDAGPDAAERYALYLAGLSHWSQWFAQGDAGQWNSIILAQTLYQDLRADGLLDGLGDDPTTPLGFGTVALNADVYRRIFSLHLLAFAQAAGLDTDKLLATAQAMAAQTTLLPGDALPAVIDNQAPQLTLQQRQDIDNEAPPLPLDVFADKPHSGVFMLQVGVAGLLGARNLMLSIVDSTGQEIDDKPQQHPMRGSGKILIIVDTTDYDDGEYTFTVNATDLLGQTTEERFRIQFDNTAPTVTLTSPASTNQTTATLSGTFADNIAGVAAIRVAGREATLFTDGTWQAEVELGEGATTVPIEVEDRVGNRRNDITATLYLDQSPPRIDSTNRHGQARLSNGDGSAGDPAPLQDSNAILYFESDRLDLGGTLIDRFALDSAGLPYFAFAVSDDTLAGVPTASEDIRVRMRYRHNEQVLNDWHPLTPVAGEYLIPLASETLAADWHRATPTDQHIIDIAVTDPAGNTTTTQFDFYADIYVPAFDIANDNGDASNHIDQVGQSHFANTTFADRANLNDLTFASTAYTFRNTTGKAFYISLNDAATHTTSQLVDKLVREHRIHLKTTTEWRIGLMRPTANCPDFDPVNGNWQYPTAVWNWNGTDWVQEQVPGPSYGSEEMIFEDALPADPAPSVWSEAPDFDSNFKDGSAGTFPSLLTYLYDYTLDPQAPLPTAAYVLAWTYRPDVQRSEIQTCPNARYFQQRQTYAYENVAGYPKGVLSTETLAGTPGFSTTGFSATDDDAGAEIMPTGGWYRIPAGHSATITKQVTTPTLTFYNDDISDPNSATYTPRLSDKTISWHVDQGLDITVIHDAGEANLAGMPQRHLHVGNGMSDYQISR